MKCNKMFVCAAVFFLVGTLFSSSYALAQTFSSRSAVSTTYQPAPSFQTLYGSQATTYWPILGDAETCDSREDFMLQMAPFGCQPTVVRSDLLAEQNVPVFCQINAIDINPLIKVEQIKNIDFTIVSGSEGVVDVGFHPARAALRSQNTLIGSPLVNNIGYAVVLLQRQPDESKLPDSVNVTLSARISYEADNAYGIGRSDFILEPTSFEEWQREKSKTSFWNGRYFLRLESADDNYAEVSIYEGDRKAVTTRVQKGQTSGEFYVPGMYCRAGLTISYDSYVAAQKKARIEVSSGRSYDVFDVYEGSNFMDGRCTVNRIDIDSRDGETGRVIGTCSGKQFVLELKARTNESSVDSIFVDGRAYPVDRIGGRYWIDLTNHSDSTIKGTYYFDGDNMMKEGGLFIMNSTTNSSMSDRQRTFFSSLYGIVKNFVIQDSGGTVSSQSAQYFDQAIQSYERVADDYPSESDGLYGKEALQHGVNLARDYRDEQTQIRLMNRYIGLYPGDVVAESYASELENIRQFDTSLSGEAIQFDNSAKVLRLVSLSSPSKKAMADFSVGGRGLRLALDSTNDLSDGNRSVGRITLDRVETDKVEVGAYCMQRDGRLSIIKESYLFGLGETKRICQSVDVRLDSIDAERAVKLRLTPKAEGSRTETNFTVFVGIEKRAIQLTPDKVSEKIENLNKTIQKWENIVENLGKLITGLKGACFATATLLTFKNFMTGLSGESIARQEVMNGENGWKERCRALVPNTYPTMDSCFIAKSSEIDAEVASTTAAINKVNERIQQIQATETRSTDIFGKSVDTDAVRKKLAAEIKQEYGTQTINLGNKTWKTADGRETNTVTINDILTEENVNNNLISTEGMRSLMLNAELQKQGGLGEGHLANVNWRLMDTAERVNENMVVNWEFLKNQENQMRGYPAAFEAASQNAQTRYASVKSLASEQLRAETGLTDPSITHFAVVRVPPGVSQQRGSTQSFEGGMYNLGLEGDPQTGTYVIRKVVKQGNITQQPDPSLFSSAYSLGNIKSLDSTSYQNEIQNSDRYVRYYETEPYKGMPAIVPFDTRAGWYAATQQTLPVFGGIGAFDASGRVTSFWICNVGQNGRIQFDSGFGDDLCQQINLNTGQPLNAFPGLDSSAASALVQRGQRAITEAANQYGNRYVTIGGERFEVGAPSVGTASTSCQDFMSPKDCHLLFNVCDPVVCPPSRCNLGGTYHVANVAQTGIIGSIFLCLPNIREGILIPVCLTGIHAGIEGWISIMKNYRDCLQENLETGQMVGICDQIYSIYLCEFFWNQIAPFVNVIIPKLIEMAYGQGVRGGAEYLSVMGAWQNMENSINYFTQSYAVNSFEAFRARGVQEIGTEVCKAFISVKAPTDLDTLLEPDSPPQFHAWFDEQTFTTATVPATSQYKVFYHIFAGNDQGVYYNVYLRDPPASGYYMANPVVQVASGFAPKGEYRSETRDFTAPQGYKELCVRVNNQEECGFRQVSTSFAVNYLRDQYIKDEASRVTITSQRECVSGSNNIAALLTPNLQQGAEEFISPELYNRGIIRICSTDNPGSQTDPSRFIDVGYCDTQQVRCWIDQRSIEQAITQGNIGTLNETLEVLEQRSKELLEMQNLTYSDSEAANKLMLLKGKVRNLASADEALAAITEANALLGELYWNRHKAEALILRGDAQAYLARHYRTGEDEVARIIRVVPESTEQPPQISIYVLGERDSFGMQRVYFGGVDTKIIYRGGVFYDTTQPLPSTDVNVRVAFVDEAGIIMRDAGEITDVGVLGHVNALNGRRFNEVFGGGVPEETRNYGEPYRDGTWIRIDIAEGNSYALNEGNDLLYYWTAQSRWIDVATDPAYGFESKNDTEKEWIVNLRTRLLEFKSSGTSEPEEQIPAPTESQCRRECGFFCSQAKCAGLGACYFVEGFFWSSCEPCLGISSCSQYPRGNQIACEADMCGVEPSEERDCSYEPDGSCIVRIISPSDGGAGWIAPAGIEPGSFLYENRITPVKNDYGEYQFPYPGYPNTFVILDLNNSLQTRTFETVIVWDSRLSEIPFEGQPTYRQLKEELCRFKNAREPGSCIWDSDGDVMPPQSLPPEERFSLTSLGSNYILFTKMSSDALWVTSKLFVLSGSDRILLDLDGEGVYSASSGSVQVGTLSGRFDGVRERVDVAEIDPAYANEMFAGVSLCNFKSFVKRPSRGDYGVELGFSGSGSEGCLRP